MRNQTAMIVQIMLVSWSVTACGTPEPTATPTLTLTAIPTNTATLTVTPSRTATTTPTSTPTNTPTATATPTVAHTQTPISPLYKQMIFDCDTGALVEPDTLIQPPPMCDSWEINRYERPFNAGTQDEYYPDLDILSAELGQADGWYFLEIMLFDPREDSGLLEGVYGIEFDLDRDGRGDVLILAQGPREPGETDWSVEGVQVWKDSQNDVGEETPMRPDIEMNADGYDELVFNEGRGLDPDLAWVRVVAGNSAFIQIAFKPSAIDNAEVFKWWVWSDQAPDAGEFDYHDYYEHEDAGDVYEGDEFFPSKDIHSLDNTCAAIWGGPPDDDPSLCVNEPPWASVNVANASCRYGPGNGFSFKYGLEQNQEVTVLGRYGFWLLVQPTGFAEGPCWIAQGLLDFMHGDVSTVPGRDPLTILPTYTEHAKPPGITSVQRKGTTITITFNSFMVTWEPQDFKGFFISAFVCRNGFLIPMFFFTMQDTIQITSDKGCSQTAYAFIYTVHDRGYSLPVRVNFLE